MTEIHISKNFNIERLQKWLNYEISASLLLLAAFFSDFAIYIMALAALLFTPLLLITLFREKRYGWVIFFFIIVAVPVVIIPAINTAPLYARLLYTIPLALFYFYCFLLKITVGDW